MELDDTKDAEEQKFRSEQDRLLNADTSEILRYLRTRGIKATTEDRPRFRQLLAEAYYWRVYWHPEPGRSPHRFVIEDLVAHSAHESVLDPHAGEGRVINTVLSVVSPPRVAAITDKDYVGKRFHPGVQWYTRESAGAGLMSSPGFDLIVSDLVHERYFPPLRDAYVFPNAETVGIQKGVVGFVVAVCQRLIDRGRGVFLVPADQFVSVARAVVNDLEPSGLTLSAALAIPGSQVSLFGHRDAPAYVIVVEKGIPSTTFVARLSHTDQTNRQILKNYRDGQDTGSVHLGRVVPAHDFLTIDVLELEDEVRASESACQRLVDLAVEFDPYSSGTSRGSVDTIYLPFREHDAQDRMMEGQDLSAVVLSADDLDPGRSYYRLKLDSRRILAPFAAMFLDTELGRRMRAHGSILSTDTYNTWPDGEITLSAGRLPLIPVPDLQTQRDVLRIQSRMRAAESALDAMQREIHECRKIILDEPSTRSTVSERVDALWSRAAGYAERLTADPDAWIESLPFPLASILRVWRSTRPGAFKEKYEHLLHYFEAFSELAACILLSAFDPRGAEWPPAMVDLVRDLSAHHQKLARPTFGTWIGTIKILGGAVRELLSRSDAGVMLPVGLFEEPSRRAMEVLSRRTLLDTVAKTNRWRNDWTGHGGVVGNDEARRRHEVLSDELETLRQATGDLWSNVQVVRALSIEVRNGVFQNEVEILRGSNSMFLRETRAMSTYLESDRLYVAAVNGDQALLLLPFVRVESLADSSSAACYFFSRFDGKRARYVSYHYTGKAEITLGRSEVSDFADFLDGMEAIRQDD
jgi:hypothetical protein